MYKFTFKTWRTNTATFAALIVLVSFEISSCKKGDKGTANVIYSEWFTPNPYIKDTVFGSWGFKFNKSAPDITKAILDGGTVITYGKLLGYNSAVWPVTQVAALPITLTYNQGGMTNDTWSALVSEGNLRIRFVNDKNIYTSIANNHQFRYIIIPAEVKASASGQEGVVKIENGTPLVDAEVQQVATNFKNMSYNNVCEKLKIAP